MTSPDQTPPGWPVDRTTDTTAASPAAKTPEIDPARLTKPSIGAVCRVWWMLTWRSVFISFLCGMAEDTVFYDFGPVFLLAPVPIYPIVAIVMVVVFKKTFAKRPLLGLLKDQPPVVSLTRHYNPHALARRTRPHTPPGSPRYTSTSRTKTATGRAPERPTIDKPTNRGTLTGFEPEKLKNVPMPTSDHMHGSPGIGLGDSGFGAQAIELGQAGEANFAKVLGMEGFIDKFPTFWSVHLPDENGDVDEKYRNVDIDCVILTGDTLWLVDLKNYRQGDVTYRTYGERLYVEDNATGSWVGEPYKMSRNMSNAELRFSKLLTRKPVRVESVVVFMPTPMGVGQTTPETRWPDRVKTYMLPDFLDRLRTSKTYDSKDFDVYSVSYHVRKLLKS
jgi:hypothetical protein